MKTLIPRPAAGSHNVRNKVYCQFLAIEGWARVIPLWRMLWSSVKEEVELEKKPGRSSLLETEQCKGFDTL